MRIFGCETHSAISSPDRIVDVDHRGPDLVVPKQAFLGRSVRAHVPVEVEVVLGEVGEGRDRELGRGDPAQFQGMRRDLGRDHVGSQIAHLGEQTLEVGGLGRGPLRDESVLADPGVHRADEPRACARRRP